MQHRKVLSKKQIEEAVDQLEDMAADIQFGKDKRMSKIRWGEHIPEEFQGERDGLIRAAKHIRERFNINTKSRF